MKFEQCFEIYKHFDDGEGMTAFNTYNSKAVIRSMVMNLFDDVGYFEHFTDSLVRRVRYKATKYMQKVGNDKYICDNVLVTIILLECKYYCLDKLKKSI